MGALGGGATGLADLAARLNDGGALPLSGERWSPEVLAAELARLAFVPAKAAIDRTIVPRYDAERAQWPPASARTAPSMDVDARAEFLQTFGLRNRWYVVAASAEIGETPVGMKRLGESLVLWRDGDGAVHAVEDRCPHRGVALSIGEVHEGAITCAYHGVRVDGYRSCWCQVCRAAR